MTERTIVQATKLVIYVGDADHQGGKPLSRAIVELLRAEGFAGATVLHGIEGYGATRRIHTAKILDLSQDLPVVIVAIDRDEKIQAILPQIETLVTNGLVPLEKVRVALSRPLPLWF
jgi:PII-like signaling protein